MRQLVLDIPHTTYQNHLVSKMTNTLALIAGEQESINQNNMMDKSTLSLIGDTFNILKRFYSKHMKAAENKSIDISWSMESMTNPTNETSFRDLPVYVQRYILSFLNMTSLCSAALVCKSWYINANDDLLWDRRLILDSIDWETIDHLSHPILYKTTKTDLTSKEIYLKCCPDCKRNSSRTLFSFPKHIPNFRYYFGISIPRIAMFGSGLDSTGFVRNLIWQEKSPFKITGMFPGHDGIGSGVTFDYSGGTINLITLYGLLKSERNAQDYQQRRQSRLFVYGYDDENELTLVQSVKDLLQTIDALIYVVNTTSDDKVVFGRTEFTLMTNEKDLPLQVPLLVLCLSLDETQKPIPPIEVADKLELLNLSRPWKVTQCTDQKFENVLSGINWLNKHITGISF